MSTLLTNTLRSSTKSGGITEKQISEALKGFAKTQAANNKVTFKDVMLAARFVLTGTEVGPGVGAIVAVLGTDVCLERASFFAKK